MRNTFSYEWFRTKTRFDTGNSQCYDNSTNSRALIGQFFSSVSGETHEYAATSESGHKKTNERQFFMRLSCYKQ